MAHVIAGYYSGTLDAGTGVVTITGVDVGTGAGRAIQIAFRRRVDRFPSVTSITIGGESMTVQGSDQTIPTDTNQAMRMACRINPTVTGTQDLVITCSTTAAGSSTAMVNVEVIDGIDTGQSAPTPTVNTGSTDNVSTVTQSSATGRQIITAHAITTGDTGLDTITPTNWTLPAENSNPVFGGGIGQAIGYAAGASSVECIGTWLDNPDAPSGGQGWVAMAADWLPVSAGGLSIPIASYYHSHQQGH